MTDFPKGMVEEWEQFFRETHPKLTPGMDLYPEVFAGNTIFPLQRQGELAAMMQIARSIQPKVVAEIGADKGGGLYHWCMGLPTVRVVIGCEIRGLPYRDLFDAAFPSIRFRWLDCPSLCPPVVRGMKPSAWTIPEAPIDVLFIDGDKSAFVADFDAYLPLMNPKGVVFMHDIQDSPGPLEAFRQISSRGYQVERIVDTSDSAKAMERERRGIPLANPHESWLRHWRGRSCGVGTIFLGV